MFLGKTGADDQLIFLTKVTAARKFEDHLLTRPFHMIGWLCYVFWDVFVERWKTGVVRDEEHTVSQ